MYVINRLIEIAKKRSIQIYFGLIFILLLFVYFPSFSHPPRSDFWSAFYYLNKIHNLTGIGKWINIFQQEYAPWDPIRFQPLAYLILYVERLFWGSNFVYFNIFNFILYFISILLLYKLAINFCKSRMLTAVFLSVFAFLFSHFDIICWSYHAYIIFGFCSLLLGFILYVNFLRSGRTILLFFVTFLFLLGIFCYETFVLWPLAIVILSHMSNITERCRFKKYRLAWSYLSVIGSVYFLYFTFFLLIIIFKGSKIPFLSLSPLFSMRRIVFSTFAVFFNILYNGFIINLMPTLAFPLIIDSNLNLAGFLIRSPISLLNNLIFLGGGLFIGVFLAMIIYLFKHKRFNALKVILFFLFLLFSEFFILFHCRSLIDDTAFNLTQFRFLYIPNAFVILIVLYLMDRFLNPSKREKIIICLSLFFILISNIQASRQGISILDVHLAPLKNMLSNIKVGIKTGQINKEDRLYLDDNIAKILLPPLCWNRDMGELFMKGTYQWAFSEEEIKCFSSFEDAKWVINEEDFSIGGKPDRRIEYLKKSIQLEPNFIGASINLGHLYTYRTLRDLYINLGHIHNSRGNYDRAIEYFQKAIQLNPNSADAYKELGYISKERCDYDKAIEYFQKAIQINPNSIDDYEELGHIYNKRCDYDKATEYFQKAIQLNPNSSDAYKELGYIYRERGDYDRAIEYFQKAIQLNPNSIDAYKELGYIYKERCDYDKAIEYFQKAIQINPKFINAYSELGFIYNSKGDKKNALRQVIKLRNLNRNDFADELEQSIRK